MTTDPREQEILRLASKLREVTEERDRLLKRVDQLYYCAKESQDWNWLSARDASEAIGLDYYEIPEMQELVDMLNYKEVSLNPKSCTCNGWGCMKCCKDADEIRARQGIFG